MIRLFIILIFISLGANAQKFLPYKTVVKEVVQAPEPEPEGPWRILIDLGGTNTAGSNGTGSADGVKTPNNSAGATGQAGDGNWWNNVIDFRAGTWISSPVDINNNIITGFSISSDIKPGGAYFPGDYSINGGGTNTAVGDYPATAVRDNCYFHTGNTTSLTFVIPEGKKATIKFWGNRADAAERTLEIKKNSDGSYTQSYNAANNTNYNTAVTFTNITGTQVFNLRVKTGNTFGHLSVLDITLDNND